MSGKRVLALYGALLFCFAAVVCRLYWLCSDTDYGARAAAQSVVTLHLPARRGNFYDHRGQLLTGQTTRWMVLCVPGEGGPSFPYGPSNLGWATPARKPRRLGPAPAHPARSASRKPSRAA